MFYVDYYLNGSFLTLCTHAGVQQSSLGLASCPPLHGLNLSNPKVEYRVYVYYLYKKMREWLPKLGMKFLRIFVLKNHFECYYENMQIWLIGDTFK